MNTKPWYNKKAEVAVQFNWIFVLVAGALILLFFISIIQSVRKAEETQLAIQTVKHLDSIITGTSVAENTVFTIESSVPLNLQFGCTIEQLNGQTFVQSSYGVLDPDIAVHNNFIPVFAPQELSGQQFFLYTESFSLPFRTSRLVYATSPQVHFIIVSNDIDAATQLQKRLPKNTTVFTMPELAYYTDRDGTGARTQIIITTQPLGTLNSVQKTHLDAIAQRSMIILKEVDLEANKVSIRQYDATVQAFRSVGVADVYYFDDSTLLGALYAPSGQYYRCVLTQMQKRFTMVGHMYSERLDLLEQTSPISCAPHYSFAHDSLQTLLDLDYFFPANDDHETFVSTIMQETQNLQQQSRRVEELSCPTIY